MAIYYVDGDAGNDTNNGTSTATAKATIAAGVGLFTSSSDLLYIKAKSGGNAYVITSAISLNGGYNYTLIGYSSTPGDNGIAKISSATNSVSMFVMNGYNTYSFYNLELTSTASTKGHGVTTTGSNPAAIALYNCYLHHLNMGVAIGGGIDNISLYYTSIISNGSHGIDFQNAISYFNATNSFIYNNTGSGIQGGRDNGVSLTDTVIAKNGGYGGRWLYDFGSLSWVIKNCVVANNVSGGIYDLSTNTSILILLNNIIYGNGGYGLSTTSSAEKRNKWYVRNNAFGLNTSGPYNSNISAGLGEISLTADPFVDALNGNFAINNSLGGGGLLRATAFPNLYLGDLTPQYRDIGAAQHYEPTEAEVADAVWNYLERSLTA